MEIHRVKSCICNDLQQLQAEQEKLSYKGFRFICESLGYDTIPFILSNGKCELDAWGRTENGIFFYTNVFRVEEVDEDHCGARLTLFERVDIDGCPVDLCEDVFSLIKTNNCIIVDLNCYCSIQPLSPKLVNRPLPIIEPKC
jgi:spore coat protein Y